MEREIVAYNLKAQDYNLSTDKKNGWLSDAVNGDGTLLTFVQYGQRVLKGNIKANTPIYMSGLYAQHFKIWVEYFDSQYTLVLSVDRLYQNPPNVQ